jgi:hypothetical protein
MSTMKNILFLLLSCVFLLFSCNSCSYDLYNDVIDDIEVTKELVVKDAVQNPINGLFISASLLTLLAFAFVIGLKPISNISTPN